MVGSDTLKKPCKPDPRNVVGSLHSTFEVDSTAGPVTVPVGFVERARIDLKDGDGRHCHIL